MTHPHPGEREMSDEQWRKAHRLWAESMARFLNRPIEPLELENLGRVPFEAAWRAACAFQREEDAKLAEEFSSTHPIGVIMLPIRIAAAIRGRKEDVKK